MPTNKKRSIEEMDVAVKTKKSKTASMKTSITLISKSKPETINEINDKLKQIIADKFDTLLKTTEVKKGSELEQQIQDTIIDHLNSRNIVFEPSSLKAEIIRNFMLGLSGYGILQPLMDDDEVEDIYIYAPDKIYVLKNGKKYRSDIKFESSEKLKAFIDNILGRINRSVNTKNPIEDGRMPDGSRVAVSADVLSPNGYTMNIRRFPKERMTLDKLVSINSIDKETKELLIKVIKSRMNFIVSGGTSSGKTTMLNAMAQYIDETDNITSIEDNIELQLNKEFWLQLETRKANIEGENEINMEDLLVHILRRSPDRIIVGEIRSGEVADTFLNAIQTGHDGTCATIHANNTERCRSRMVKLASVASNQPFKACLDDFNHSINVVIQLKRDNFLCRRVCQSVDFIKENGDIVNLVKYDRDNDKYIHNVLPKEMVEIFDDYGL